MKHPSAHWSIAIATIAILVGGTALTAPRTASAQATPPANVTLDLQDAPIRSALEQIFRSAKVDFGIDPSVQGFVNLKVTNLPFESALRLILRSSTTPLTYSLQDGVYLVRPRRVTTSEPLPPARVQEAEVRPKATFEQIELTYADPADLAKLLNITMIPIGVRFGLNVPGGSGIMNPGGPGTRGTGNNGPDSGGRGNNAPGGLNGAGNGGPRQGAPNPGTPGTTGTGFGNGGVVIGSGGGRIGF